MFNIPRQGVPSKYGHPGDENLSEKKHGKNEAKEIDKRTGSHCRFLVSRGLLGQIQRDTAN